MAAAVEEEADDLAPEGGIHPTGISRRMARALKKHRGKIHVFDRLAPEKTALLVIDMQGSFLDDSSRQQPYYCPRGKAIIPRINQAVEEVRSRGGKVVWITSDVGPDSLTSWSVLYESFFPSTGGVRERIRKSLKVNAGRWGSTYDPRCCKHGMDGPLDLDLDFREGDEVVKKDRFSPLTAGGGKHQGCSPSDGPVGPKSFAESLASWGIDSLVLSGVTTGCCVEGTARDAMQLNFKVVVLSDACAASRLQHHTASLDHLAYLMADVRTVSELPTLFGV